jgi:RHS repeat-associated protein
MRDEEAGQDFFNARYFTPALGRFNSPDPRNAGANALSSQSWNGYGYVLGNPLNASDPSGRDCFARSGPRAHIAGCDGNYGAPEYGGISIDGGGAVAPGTFGSGSDGAGGESAVPCPAGTCTNISANANGTVFLNVYNPTPTLNCIGESTDNYQCSWARWSAWLVQNWAETHYYGGVQQLLNGNQQLWNNTAAAGTVLAGGTAAAVAAPYVMAVGGMPMMDLAVGPGSPFHVAFGVDGTWLHATGDAFFDMTISGDNAAAYVRGFSLYQFSVPILYPGAVLGTAGTAASTFVTGACYAFFKGWGF